MATSGYQAAVDSNDIILRYAKQAAYATDPTTGFKELRFDGEGFSASKSRTRPAEINSTGQASASITTKVESSGSLNFSMSGGTFNELIASSLGSNFSAPEYTAETIAQTSTTFTDSASGFVTAGFKVGQLVKLLSKGTDANLNGNTFRVTTVAAGVLTCTLVSGQTMATKTLAEVGCCTIRAIAMSYGVTTMAFVNSGTITDSGSGFIIAGYTKGQYIRVQGATTAGNNQIYQITAVVAGTLTVTPNPTSNEACAATTKIQGSYVRNGLVFDAFLFEKMMASNLFLHYSASFPTGGGLDVGVGDYLKGSLSFLNKSEVKGVATKSASGNVIAAPVGAVIDSMAGITNVKFNGSAVAAAVQKVGIKWNKEGAAGQYAIGQSAAQGMRKGTFTCTGSLSTYFKDFTLYDAFQAETAGAISFTAADGAAAGTTNNTYIITICQGTIMNPKIVAGGPGQDVMAEFEVEGNPDTTGTYGYKTLQIDFFEN